MIRRDYLIVGAGAASVGVCEGIREYDKKGTILLAGNEVALPYDRTALFKSLLGKTAPAPEKLAIHDAGWFAHQHIDFRLDTSVTQFNAERHLAVLQNGQAIEFRKACLATGSRARRPQFAGGNLGNVFYPRSLRDVMALREVAEIEHQIVVVGGGCIAVEAAALLSQLPKAHVTLMHRGQQLWTRRLGPELGAWLGESLAKRGVKLMLGEALNGFEGRTVLKNVQTKSGTRFGAGLAVVAVGVEHNLGLVAGTPLAYPHGTPVNDYLETDEKGIFAVGEIAVFPDRLFGGVRRLDQWDDALAQGRVAGANMSGKKRIKFDHVAHHASAVFDLHFDFVGDFTRPPTRVEIDGEPAKKFGARMFQLDALMGVVLCNQPPEKVEAAKVQLREWPRGKRAEHQ